MKRSGNRLLALLLCIAMVLTLLPMAALARWDEEIAAVPAEAEMNEAGKAELPVDAPENDGDIAEPAASEVPTDGAVADTWVQIEGSKVTGSVEPAKEEGKIVLSAAAANGNNINGQNPAIFVDTDMNKALSALADEVERTLSFTLTPSGTGAWMGFALLLRYDGTTGANIHTYQIGYPSGESTGWFTENFGASNYGYPGFTGPDMAANVPVDFEIKWTESEGISSFKIGGEVVALPSDCTLTSVPALDGDNTDGLKGVGFKVATKNSSATTLKLSNVHYTGQATETVYDISGSVTSGGKAVADVTVSTNGKSTTTDANGTYTMSGLSAGTYTLTYTKTGYVTATQSVTIGTADVTAPAVALEETDLIQIPTDGVNNGDWYQVDSTKRTGSSDPVVKDGELLLTSGNDNGYKLNSSILPALFTSPKMNEALAKSTSTGKKTLSFTLTPESVKESPDGVPDYIAFGVVIKSNLSNQGYMINFGDENWQYQSFGGNGGYGNLSQAVPTVGQPIQFEFTWDNATMTVKVNGQEAKTDCNMAGLSTEHDQVSFFVGGKRYEDTARQSERHTRIRISDLYYSGQETTNARYVSGAVKCGSKALEGAVVSVAGAGNEAYKATTDAIGSYKLAVPVSDTAYTLQATLDGYTTESKSVTVSAGADKNTLNSVDFALRELPKITGKVVDKNNKPIHGAAVSSDKRTEEGKPGVACDENGNFTIIGAVEGEHTLTIGIEGYETATVKVTVGAVGTADVDAGTIKLADRVIPFYTLSTEDMDVRVAQGFPQVIDYTMKKLKDANDQPLVMLGQTAELDTILINGAIETMTDEGKAVKPTVTSSFNEADPTKVTYTMVIDETNNNGSGVTATITAEIRVGLQDVNDATSASKGRTLGFYITNVEYAGADTAAKAANRLAHPVDNIAIPNHSLVSVRSTQNEAKVKGAKLASNTISSGDVEYPAAGNLSSATSKYKEDFFAAFVSNDQLSAGLSSNSAYAVSGSAGSANYPVRAQFEAKDGDTTTSIGLGSTLWYYDHDITRDEAGGDKAAELTAEQKIRSPLETPYAKVVIAGDENGNGTVDWQDGAIALRETILHIPAGSANVADAVNLRISMNFGSMATNPFLIALDNVKRVAAHTDGLGQFVLLKGYAGEGHDSNHPQYDNIGIRMGGPDDMKTLMEEGEKLGAVFGIHTNASEFYAEAIDDVKQVRRNSGNVMQYGWNWIDQGIKINGVYDYASGLQLQRWNKLYNIVKGHPFVVYVDVWGNNTSGTENDFMTRALSQNIIANGHDQWRIAHEWSWANPYESTFQHWVTDYTYGNYSDKGKLNSNVLRFLLNEYKDSFPADFATFGGAANAPLLGGPAMQGFEGWQGDGEYDLSIYNTFNQMVATKFLQHYDIMEWTNATKPTEMWWWVSANSSSKTAERTVENEDGTVTLQNYDSQNNRWNTYGGTVLWTPENQIMLAGDGDEIMVTRGLDTIPDDHYDYEDGASSEVAYRSRVITLNGKKIAEGAPASAGEDRRFPASKATLKYLIPWYWKADGSRVTKVEDEKLYHWNAKGGISTWELQENWKTLANVWVYPLSDQGRGQGKSVKIVDGKITLNAEAETCYVVVPGENKGNPPQITYGAGLYLEDPSFSLDTARADCPWTVEGTGSAVHTTNSEGIGILKMVGAVSVSQDFNGLEAGKSYVTYMAVDNRSDAKVTMTITDNTGKVVATNYTAKSIAHNYVSSYYLHNGHGPEAGGSYFQNMFLYFTPEADKTYTLTISREAGRGNTYVDDVRTVEYGFNYSGFGAGQTAQSGKGTTESPVEYVLDTDGNATDVVSSLYQDFENVPQGIWPFVVGPVEGVADNRTHVSELNTPFTQAGWDVKKMDDVIDGNWSVKVNGLHGRQNLVYQTIPQNFRFQPDGVYTVEFDYELGSAGSYVAVVGDGAYTNFDNLTDVINLDETLLTEVPANPTAEGCTLTTNVHKANVGHAKFTVVGSKSGQTWIGIYSKDNADNKGTSGSASAFGGYLDFVLDNLKIELAPAEKNELALKLQEADAMVPEIYTETETGAWDAFVAARNDGHTVFDAENATTQQVTEALAALTAAMNKLEKAVVSISGMVKNADNAPVEGVELTLEDGSYIPVGLTITTGADGTFQFVSKSGVELLPGAYRIKAQATGYNVTTTDAISVTKTAPSVTGQSITLEAEAPGAYVNDFNNGDISMMGYLVPDDMANLPTIEATEYNGSGALKITWNAGSGETRHLNNVVDKTITMANGTFSFDVVPLTNNGERLGITFRGQEGTVDNVNRVFVGQEDAVTKWFVEHWNDQGSPTSGYTSVTEKAIGLNGNVTRNVRAVMNNMSFQVYVDGVKIYDVDASTTLPSMITEAGYVGFNMRLHPGTEYIIDNIRIIRADAAEGVYNVSGEVEARSGAAVSGAAVELYKGEERVAGTTTNALGAYQISRVEPGSYTVKVSAPFFQGTEKTITVGSANLTGQNFTLIPDRTDLNNLIAEMDELVENDYTAETWETLAEALTAAKAINDDSTKAAIESAYKALFNAKTALERKELDPVDFSALRTEYNKVATKPNDNYTNASWGVFQEAVAAAKAVLINGDATQEQVDKAKTDLLAAVEGLEVATDPDELDLTALEAAINAAKDVEKGSASDAAWEKFTTARDAALVMFSSPDGITQADVDAAVSALKSAQSGLKKPGSGSTGGGTPAETTKTETREDGSKVITVTKPDGSKTVTVEQPDGIKSETVTTKDGDVTITVTDKNGEELVKAEIPATIPEPETKFEDLDTTPWAEEAIHKMAGLELVNGTGENKYSPIAPMTRGSLATVLHRLSQGKTDYESTFKDVAQGRYYTEGVAWAAKAGVVKGITDEIFAPEQTITREQLAVMMARYAKLVGLNTKADAKALDRFTDGDATGTWAVDGVAWCVQNGILKGKGNDTLDPTAEVTRAEVAVMLDRFISLIQK